MVVRRSSAGGSPAPVVWQHGRQVLKVVARACLLDTGRIKQRGAAAELLASNDIRKAYLGI